MERDSARIDIEGGTFYYLRNGEYIISAETVRDLYGEALDKYDEGGVE